MLPRTPQSVNPRQAAFDAIDQAYVRDRADLKAKYPSLKARRTQQARAEFDAVDARYVAEVEAIDGGEEVQ